MYYLTIYDFFDPLGQRRDCSRGVQFIYDLAIYDFFQFDHLFLPIEGEPEGGYRYFIGLVQSVVLKSGKRGHLSPIIWLNISIVYCSLW